jgi:hypothetical protein
MRVTAAEYCWAVEEGAARRVPLGSEMDMVASLWMCGIDSFG